MMKLVDIVKSAPAAKGARVPFDQIDISIHHRPTHADKVGELVQSIRTLGLQAAPVVIEREGRFKLVSGRHRLEALRVLEYDDAPVRIVGFDDLQARLWTISENLHRNELTPLQRAEQVAEYVRLMSGETDPTEAQVEPDDEKEPQATASEPEKVAQVAPVYAGGRGNTGGVRAASRELGITRDKASRSVKIDSIAPAAKEAAREAGLDRNQSALLKIASYPDEDQVEAVKEIAKARAERATAPRAADLAHARPRGAPPLRSLENIAAGSLALWIKETTPNDRLHIIDVLERAAAILRTELQSEQAA